MVTCNFHFENNEEAVYFVGQTVRGFVELQLEKPQSIRSLQLIVGGDALAFYDHQRHNRFVGKELYLNNKTVLFGASDGPTRDLPAGLHRFDFQCKLPENIPPSFEYKHDYHLSKAHIRYWIELKIDVHWKMDKEFKKDFKVLNVGNLNLSPDLALPCSAEEKKIFCCLCCASDPLLMEVRIPQSGYVGGQPIPVHVKYINKSAESIYGTEVCLHKVFMMFSSSDQSRFSFKKKIEDTQIVSATGDGVEKTSENVVFVNLQVPDTLEFSNDRHCRVITVSYELSVTALGPLFRKDLKVTFPITIGSIPIEHR